MGRPSKPFFRKQNQTWYCSIAGRQIRLSKDKEAAEQQFHELMADRDSVLSEIATVYDLSQKYLDWVEANRKPGTYYNNRHYLESFVQSVGKRLKIGQVKQHHLTTWTAAHPQWSATVVNDAMSIVQRLFNWSVEEGYIRQTPLLKIRKPRRRRRDIFYTDEQWGKIKKLATPPFDDLLDFLYITGCRPAEARSLEAKHISNDLAILPIEQSKGERESRVIFLVPEAMEIAERLRKQHPKGKLFLNRLGNPWTKDAIKCRLARISEKVGFRVIAYGARHSWATNALTKGGIDPISAAHLMGHKDPTMVSRVYSHLAKNPDFLRAQARQAIARADKGS